MKLSIASCLLLVACAIAPEQPAPPALPVPEPPASSRTVEGPPTSGDPPPCAKRSRIVIDGVVFSVPIPCDPTPATRDLGDPQP